MSKFTHKPLSGTKKIKPNYTLCQKSLICHHGKNNFVPMSQNKGDLSRSCTKTKDDKVHKTKLQNYKWFIKITFIYMWNERQEK